MASQGFGTRVGVALLALAPPTLVGAGLWPTVREHPLWSAVALLGWWTVLLASRVVRRVVNPVWERVVQGAADRFGAVAFKYRTRYLRGLAGHVRHVELLGATTPTEFAMRLPDVYVDVSLKRRSPEGGATTSAERRSLDEFIGDPEHRVYAVTGGPGSGKTTLLKHTALRLARGRGRLPIFLELRQHVDAITGETGATVATLAAAEGWLDTADAAAWFRRQLERGRCLVMLDGLDEVGDETKRRRTVAWVRRQTERYPGNTYVITSRPHGYEPNRLGNADELVIRSFTGEQITHFTHQWYRATLIRRMGESGPEVERQAARRADELLDRLRVKPALYNLATNPLLLTMITNVHLSGNVLPGSRAALYREIVDMLLHRRQEAKELPVGLRGEQKSAVCQELAAHMMKERVRDIPFAEARRVISRVLASVSPGTSAEDFLIEARDSGLLVQPSEEAYAFAHLTFQEFLTAAAVKENQRIELLTENVKDPWWQETTLLWASGADASPVIDACIADGGTVALTLAFACEQEAKAIRPDSREALRAQLAVTADMPPEKRRAITAVKVGRALDEAVWLGQDTVVCARPVSRELYGMYLADQGLCRRAEKDGPGDEPELGMWDVDAAGFVGWGNSLPGGGRTYRLPTAAELADPSIDLVVDLTRHTVWTEGGLWRRENVRSPYQLDGTAAWRVLRSALLDRVARIEPHVEAVRRLELARVLTEAYQRAVAIGEILGKENFGTRRSDYPDVGPLLKLLAPLREPYSWDAYGRAIDWAQALRGHLSLAQNAAGSGDLELAGDHEMSLRRAKSTVSSLIGVLRALSDEAVDELRSVEADPAFPLDTDAGDDPGTIVRRAILRRMHDLDTGGGSVDDLVDVLLLALWNGRHRESPGRRLSRPVSTTLGALVHDLSGTVRPEEDGRPGAVSADLAVVHDLLLSEGSGAPSFAALVARVIGHVRDLTEPMLAARAPWDSARATEARALITIVARGARSPRITEPLRRAALGLAVAQQRADGTIPVNEVLLLVRA